MVFSETLERPRGREKSKINWDRNVLVTEEQGRFILLTDGSGTESIEDADEKKQCFISGTVLWTLPGAELPFTCGEIVCLKKNRYEWKLFPGSLRICN